MAGTRKRYDGPAGKVFAGEKERIGSTMMKDDEIAKARDKARLRASLSHAGMGGGMPDDKTMDYTGKPGNESFLSRLTRTETAVRDKAASFQQKQEAAAACHHSMCAMMLYAQWMLYGTLSVLKNAGSAAWWLTALQLLPALALYFLMRGLLRLHPGRGLWGALEESLGGIGARICGAVYVLLIWWDGQTALYALSDLVSAYMLMEADFWGIVIAAAAACAVCAWSGGRYGVSRMCYLLRWVLGGVLLVLIAAALSMGSVSNLYPYLGPGLESDLRAGLGFLGAAWPAVLFGFVPMETPGKAAWPSQKPGGLRFLIPAGVLCALLFLAYCLVLPSGVFQSPMSWGEQMVLFLTSAPSKLIWEGLLQYKTLLLLMVTAGCASLGARLMQSAFLYKAPLALYGAILLALMLPIPGFHTPEGSAFLEAFAPYRLPIAALPLILGYAGTLVKRLKERREAA